MNELVKMDQTKGKAGLLRKRVFCLYLFKFIRMKIEDKKSGHFSFQVLDHYQYGWHNKKKRSIYFKHLGNIREHKEWDMYVGKQK